MAVCSVLESSVESTDRLGKYGGTLKTGNSGCHTPRTGRPTNESRLIATKGFEAGAAEITRRLEEPAELNNQDLARLTDTLGKYGPGSKVDVSSEVPAILASAASTVLMPTLVPLMGEEQAKELCVRLFQAVEQRLSTSNPVA